MKHAARHGRAPAARRGRGCRRLLANALVAVGVVLLVVAAGMWGLAQWRYRMQDRINRELGAYATVYDVEQGASLPPEVDWEGLKAVNGDVVGWLQIPGTTINYPVYQGTDNVHYLRHSATGEWTVGGQLFLDCEGTRPGMVDQLTLLYGHHLLDGTMFEQVAAMDDQDAFDAVETVWYVTEERAWELQPLLVFYAQEYDQTVRTFAWESDEAFHSYLTERLAHAPAARADAAREIARTDRVLCLITCNYYEEYGNHGRTILVCAPKEGAEAPA